MSAHQSPCAVEQCSGHLAGEKLLTEFAHFVPGPAGPTGDRRFEQLGEPGLIEGGAIDAPAGPSECRGWFHQRAVEIEERPDVSAARPAAHVRNELIEFGHHGCSKRCHAGNAAVRR
jgi:hypothetical protein